MKKEKGYGTKDSPFRGAFRFPATSSVLSGLRRSVPIFLAGALAVGVSGCQELDVSANDDVTVLSVDIDPATIPDNEVIIWNLLSPELYSYTHDGDDELFLQSLETVLGNYLANWGPDGNGDFPGVQDDYSQAILECSEEGVPSRSGTISTDSEDVNFCRDRNDLVSAVFVATNLGAGGFIPDDIFPAPSDDDLWRTRTNPLLETSALVPGAALTSESYLNLDEAIPAGTDPCGWTVFAFVRQLASDTSGQLLADHQINQDLYDFVRQINSGGGTTLCASPDGVGPDNPPELAQTGGNTSGLFLGSALGAFLLIAGLISRGFWRKKLSRH